MSAGVKDKSLNSYTIYVCTCVRCVCDERGKGEGGVISGRRCQSQIS